ncbi:MAG: hypothetical protein ACUVXI_14540 [bacterium]
MNELKSIALGIIVALLVGCALAEPRDEGSSLLIGRVILDTSKSGGDFQWDYTIIVRGESNTTFRAVADDRGYFLIPNIDPGEYTIDNIVLIPTRGGDTIRYSVGRVEISRTRVNPAEIAYMGDITIIPEKGSLDIPEEGLTVSIGIKMVYIFGNTALGLGVDTGDGKKVIERSLSGKIETRRDENPTSALNHIVKRYPDSGWAKRAKAQMQGNG